MLVPTAFHFLGKVSCNYMPNVTEFIKRYLSACQVELFRKTCFGHLLDMDQIICQGQLIHGLLLREVASDDVNAICFKIGESILRFGIEEFGLISGLKCHGDIVDVRPGIVPDGGLMDRYFPDDISVTKLSLEEAIKYRRWVNDEDAVKLCVLFLIHKFIVTTRYDKLTNKDFLLVDSGLYEQYLWGLVSFRALFNCIKGRLVERGSLKNSKTPFHYCVDGCPAVFQA